jgi:hypothetical protein
MLRTTKPAGWGRWHPSRSTPEQRERIRETWPDGFRWMFGGLFSLLHEMEQLEPGHRNLRPMNLILLRRLEAA